MRTIKRYFVAIVVALTLGVTGVVAQSYSVPQATESLSVMSDSELWNKGNTAYANDNFVDAERYYIEIIERGLYSSELYYNIGNLYHKQGELGRSLLYYYKALQLSPADRDVLHNIKIAEAKTKDRIESIPTIFIADWIRGVGAMMGCLGWSISSLVFFAILLGVLLLYILAQSLKWRRVGFWSTLVFALLFILSTRFALVARDEIVSPNEAIVMSRSMSVKSSPNEASTDLFILHEGTKVRVITPLEKWCEIVIEDGKSGWVESGKIEYI